MWCMVSANTLPNTYALRVGACVSPPASATRSPQTEAFFKTKSAQSTYSLRKLRHGMSFGFVACFVALFVDLEKKIRDSEYLPV